MANYKLLVPFILRWEGGWADDKDDKGGKTNRGITIDTYNALAKQLLGIEPSLENFRQLTKEQAGLFVKYFWDKSTGNNRINSQKIAEAITTWRWGSGGYGLKEFQRLLNEKHNANLKVDGGIGTNTVGVVNKIDENKLFDEMIIARKLFFENLAKRDPSQMKFLKGWTNRLSNFAQTHGTTIKQASKIGLPIFIFALATFFF